ncbi:class I SAM-dependent methyltransferase [Dichotomicrobium thermohalophilum]|uniref:Methyltransferase family protein n=1 Tax=Dichotomicrobium thermohalophilum TaxID=933063 RepID=A0A397Q3N6_9HYPH|nr:class I SAM-dependent methyltransferase [Dichotomicrobium thermohalophilum]RIA55019.1 methyltransferase family protein [Dichotomicrobium thermohalophilum]
MTGFSTDWLDLREEADQRARDADLEARLADHFAGREELRIVDLGCGTGANARALAAHLPGVQHWRFVDNDPDLLAAARARMAQWGAAAGDPQGDLHMVAQSKQVHITFQQADLSSDLSAVIEPNDDLITAAAFFDLVSPAWIARFVETVAATGAVFYTVLIYDGEEVWMPSHEADNAVHAAFRQHQRGDKGFGPAAGSDAADLLIRRFAEAGYHVHAAPSPWRLEAPDRALIAALADGTAQAARETGLIDAATAHDWRTARANADAAIIGHVDLLALPPAD